jgi:hypothetical protein
METITFEVTGPKPGTRVFVAIDGAVHRGTVNEVLGRHQLRYGVPVTQAEVTVDVTDAEGNTTTVPFVPDDVHATAEQACAVAFSEAA